MPAPLASRSWNARADTATAANENERLPRARAVGPAPFAQLRGRQFQARPAVSCDGGGGFVILRSFVFGTRSANHRPGRAPEPPRVQCVGHAPPARPSVGFERVIRRDPPGRPTLEFGP